MMMSPTLMPMRNSIRRSGGTCRVALGHPALDIDRAAYRVDDAGELDQHAVAGRLNDAAAVLRDLRIDNCASGAFSAASVPSSSTPISRE